MDVAVCAAYSGAASAPISIKLWLGALGKNTPRADLLSPRANRPKLIDNL
jgi:hypothetical protein